MKTHELAKYLLTLPNEELYSEDFWDTEGTTDYRRDGYYYNKIKSVNFDRVEFGAVIEIGDMVSEVNNRKYKIGDAFVLSNDYFSYNDVIDLINLYKKNGIKSSELIVLEEHAVMLLLQNNVIFNYKHDIISFYNENERVDTFLYNKILVVIENGFNPKMKEMSLDEAEEWYKTNFKSEWNSLI